MTNELTSRKMKLLADTLMLAGFEYDEETNPGGKVAAIGAYPEAYRLVWPSSYRRTYLGTYLNPFSVSSSRTGAKCRLWRDEYAIEGASVMVYPVYRRNGAKEDVSVGLNFSATHTKFSDHDRFAFDRKNPAFMAAIREEAPYDYTSDPARKAAYSTRGDTVRVAKLPNTAGVKAVAKAVAKAVEMARAFEPADHSGMEADRGMFHADTGKEYFGG